MKAATYCRVSTDQQGERGTSLDNQLADCRKLAAELGADIVAEYQDIDSGASWDLPGLMALLDAAKRKEFDTLLVYDPDRLARRLAKQLLLEEELTRFGVSLRYVTMRFGDTAEDRLLKNVRSIIAEYEREKIALRTARGRWAKAQSGMVVGNGWAPYGYRFRRDAENRVVSLEHDPATAMIARRIITMVTTTTIRETCATLNRERVPSYHGGQWADSTIIGMLANTVYVGAWQYGKSGKHGTVSVAVPPLVDQAIWDEAHAAMHQRRQSPRPKAGFDDLYLLRGLLTCGACGGAMACVPNNGGHRYYLCLRNQPGRAQSQHTERCSTPAVNADLLEPFIWTQLVYGILVPETLQDAIAHADAFIAKASHAAQHQTDLIDKQRGRAQTRLDRALMDRLDTERGSAAYVALGSIIETVSAELARLEQERSKLASAPPESDYDALVSVQALVQSLGNVTTADPSLRRWLYERLRLSGMIREDPEHGVKIGRQHRFSIVWEIGSTAPMRDLKKTRLRFYTPEYAEWEAKHMDEVKAPRYERALV